MKNYLSFGAGVNSVALYLLMQDLGIQFEAVFVDHGGDWPETYEYVEYFVATGRPVTVLTPDYQGCKTLLQFCKKNRMTPNMWQRWCTQHFKVAPVLKYCTGPGFQHIGIAAEEAKRAKISIKNGIENRFLLIENDIDRDGCVDIIKKHGLNVPIKSGCYICPFQRASQWRQLRREHPDLFCIASKIEEQQNEARAEKGKGPHWVRKGGSLSSFINDKQTVLPGLENLEYPPCQCGL